MLGATSSRFATPTLTSCSVALPDSAVALTVNAYSGVSSKFGDSKRVTWPDWLSIDKRSSTTVPKLNVIASLGFSIFVAVAV